MTELKVAFHACKFKHCNIAFRAFLGNQTPGLASTVGIDLGHKIMKGFLKTSEVSGYGCYENKCMPH